MKIWKRGPNGKTLAERFNEKVDRSGGANACWPWMASRRHGYGQIGSGVGRGVLEAHRVAYELQHGPVPDGLVVMHTCDNRACCNPAHLRAGTQAENVTDCIAKGRARYVLRERPPRGKLNVNEKLSDHVPEIRRRLAAGESCKDIAERFGCSAPAISSIATGRTYAWR